MGICFVARNLEETYSQFLADQFNREIDAKYRQTTAMRNTPIILIK